MTIRLETERLTLRPMGPEDIDAHCDMMADPEMARFLTPDGVPRARSEEWRAAASYLGHWQIRGFGFFSVLEKETGDWVGRVGPWMPEGWPGLECGWSIVSSRWGKGYAAEAAIVAVRWTFERFPELARIISVIDPDNRNSQAVALKIGESKTDERFDYAGLELEIWAASRTQWLRQFG